MTTHTYPAPDIETAEEREKRMEGVQQLARNVEGLNTNHGRMWERYHAQRRRAAIIRRLYALAAFCAGVGLAAWVLT